MRLNQRGNITTTASIAVVVLVIGAIGAFLIFGSDDSSTNNASTDSQPTVIEQVDPETGDTVIVEQGSYIDYSPQAVADAGDDVKVIFFRADWCPECRAFERNLLDAPIPDGLTIFKADYDRETELKKRYDVTYQTRFVQVDSDLNEITQWQGFGRDDVNTVLENVIQDN